MNISVGAQQVRSSSADGAWSVSSEQAFTALESIDVPTVLGRVRVHVGGRGPAILFWPSLMMSGSMWSAQAAHFVGTHQVVLIDPPGHGDSESLTRGFTFEQCAQSIVQILDALGIGRAHFVGNSWGGMIGGTFAALHPDRVGVSVLMNCTASPCGLRQKLEFAMLIRIVLLIGVRGPLVQRVIDAFVGPTTRRERPQVLQTIRDALKRIKPRSVRWAIDSVVPKRPDQRALLANIRTPVLVVAGVEDATFPVAETQVMANAIPNAEFLVMPATAHLAGLEQPQQVNRLIENFIKAHE
ncbi:MAG: alpha/beta fold hydrolase [Nevskia sp.]|nr:alpha/beta fold hydrolase [Nevskia sp.]